MALSIKPYARALFEAAAGKTKQEVGILVSGILKQLSEKRLLNRMNELTAEIERLDDAENGRLRARLTSAHRLDESTVAKLERVLKHRTGAKEIAWEKHVDQSLFGGVVIRYGDIVLDLSLATSVEQLAVEIKK